MNDSKTKIALSATETAQLMGLSKPVIYRLTKRDDFPCVHIGRRCLISRQGLEDWFIRQSADGK